MSDYSILKNEEVESEKYRLETENGLVKLSQENVQKVFAMMADSPQYKRAAKTGDKESSSYIFNSWKKDNNISKDNLYNLLKRLNNENHTRVSEDDLNKMCENISNISDIISNLKMAHYCLITKITEGCSKKHFSFATKFCHYACLYLLEGEYRDNFPIFDTIMRINLEKYSDTWKSTTIKVNNKETEIKKLEEYKDVDLTTFYKTYVKVISDLAKENKISKTGVEQLIWYYHNGD